MTNRPMEAVLQRRDIERGCTITMRMRRGDQETTTAREQTIGAILDFGRGRPASDRPAGHGRRAFRQYADSNAKPFDRTLTKVVSGNPV